MKILGSDIRVGNIIEYKNDLWKCLKNQTSNRGNLRSHNQVELKSITKGTKLNERFRADETVERASLEEKKFQFLYSANDEFFFMDSVNFEQISIQQLHAFRSGFGMLNEYCFITFLSCSVLPR